MRHAGFEKPNGDPDQSALAHRINAMGGKITPQAIQYLCDPKKNALGSRHTAAIAAACGVSAVWLATEEGEMRLPAVDVNVRPAQTGGRRVPVLNKIPAGGPKQIIDDYLAGAGMDDIATDQEVGKYAFALIINGTSMEPKYKTGDKVIIDPDVRPRPGDFVAAKCNGDEGTFKKYRPRGHDTQGNEVFELVPLNEDYPILRSDQMRIEIIGTEVEHRSYRRVN